MSNLTNEAFFKPIANSMPLNPLSSMLGSFKPNVTSTNQMTQTHSVHDQQPISLERD